MDDARPADDRSWRIGAVAAGIGAAVVVASIVPTLLSNDFGGRLAFPLFIAWALIPYGVLLVAGRFASAPWPIAGAGAAAIAGEAGVRLSVFVFPRGSTAAIALVFSPIFLLVICMPAGAVVGFLAGRAFRAGRSWIGGLTVAFGIVALGLLTLDLARPELFPTTVYARRRAGGRIGPPGVRVGADMFERVPISSATGWWMTGDFDGRPGDEIALVERDNVHVLDPQSFVEREQATLGGESSRWNWFSQLARAGGRLVRVDGGGGFQETLVRELDGTLLWRYHPDPQLPPSALRSGDLDGDGETEFYATPQTGLVRLDTNGHEVWRRSAANTSIVSVTAKSALAPAWIVTTDGSAGVRVWDADGQPLGAVTMNQKSYRPALGAVEWLDRRLLASGGDRLTLQQLDGPVVFEWRVDDMSIVGVAVARFATGGPAVLAILASTDRDLHLARLQIIDADRTVLFDEVLAALPRVLTARASDGTIGLLVGTDHLDALRLKRR